VPGVDFVSDDIDHGDSDMVEPSTDADEAVPSINALSRFAVESIADGGAMGSSVGALRWWFACLETPGFCRGGLMPGRMAWEDRAFVSSLGSSPGRSPLPVQTSSNWFVSARTIDGPRLSFPLATGLVGKYTIATGGAR
jgi:hypothetical protein